MVLRLDTWGGPESEREAQGTLLEVPETWLISEDVSWCNPGVAGLTQGHDNANFKFVIVTHLDDFGSAAGLW